MAPKKKQRTKTFPVNWQKLDADANEGADAKQAELAKQKELEGIVNPIMMKVYQAAGGAPDGGQLHAQQAFKGNGCAERHVSHL